jgi:hypothetical protein
VPLFFSSSYFYFIDLNQKNVRVHTVRIVRVHACVLLFLQFGKPKQVHVTCSKLPQVFVASTIVFSEKWFCLDFGIIR